MNSKSLKNAWRVANNQQITPEDVPLPKVCTRLDSWMASDYVDPCRRLSLRASAILVDGAAKLYRQGLNDLVQDTFELEYQLITRKRPKEFYTEDSDESSTTEYEQQSAPPPGHSASPVIPDTSDGQSGQSGNEIYQKSHNKKARTQNTVSVKSTLNERNSCTGTDQLPIGQVLIYEGTESLVPNKIIVGTVNPEVKKNIKF